MAQFDPNDATADEVNAKLEKANASERDRILAAERAGKARKSVLGPAGIDPDERVDADGRTLYPWEVTGEDMADANRHSEETDEAREAREAQAEQDALVAGASDQGGSDAPGSGVAPSSGTTTGPATGVASAAGGTAGRA